MVAGGASTVTGWPPDISQVPPHCAAVPGPQPVVSGRELGPPPTKCGPGLVAALLGPAVHWPLLQRPLEHSAAWLQPLPSGTLVAPSEVPLPGPEPESFLVLLPQAETPTKL